MYLNFFSRDYPSKDISARLFIDPKTVHNHLFNIRKKLNIHKSIEIFSIFLGNNSNNEHIKLTYRGKRVLYFYMKGFTEQQIGEVLKMSENGVRRHKEKMLIQNNCKTMNELVAKYYGLLADSLPDCTGA